LATSTQALTRNSPCPCGSGKRYKNCHGALALDPRLERAQALRLTGHFAAALAALDAALAEAPDSPALLNAQGFARQELMDLEGAERSYRRAIALSADYAHAHFNLALVLLIQGRYEEGWIEYAWRTRRPNYNDWADFQWPMPRWNREPLAGKRILVHAEQGLGDTIQCARFLEPLAHAGAEVDVFCHPPIEALMQRMRGVHRAYATLQERPTHDFHAPLIDVAAHFLPTADAPHWMGRYLAPLPERVEQWAGELSRAPRPRVGFVWKGHAQHPNDWMRSLPPELAVAFARQAPGVSFVNLQFGEAPPAGAGWIDVGTRLRDWDDTLAVLHHVDLVVAVDTSVAHAAAAMERPVWLLRHFAPEWRWGVGTGKTPWYPSMELFAQPAPGDWKGLLAKIAARLSAQYAQRS
jgi:hypothetical protein